MRAMTAHAEVEDQDHVGSLAGADRARARPAHHPMRLAQRAARPAASGAIACALGLMACAAQHAAPASVALHLDVLAGQRSGAPSQDIVAWVADLAAGAAPNRIIATRIVRDLATRVDLSFEALSPDPDDTDALFIMHGAQL